MAKPTNIIMQDDFFFFDSPSSDCGPKGAEDSKRFLPAEMLRGPRPTNIKYQEHQRAWLASVEAPDDKEASTSLGEVALLKGRRLLGWETST